MARPALSGSRTIEILNLLAAHPNQAFTLTELANRLEINLASAHAVLAALTDAGYLVRHPSHKTYELGPLLIPIGRAASERHAVVEVARTALTELTAGTALEGLVVGATRSELVILERVGKPLAPGQVTTIGQRIALVPPMGAAFVATAQRDAVDEWARRAAPTVGKRSDLESILSAVRARGFSVGLAAQDRRRMRAALRELQETPGSSIARSQLDDTISALSRSETVLGSIDRRRSYAVAHVAAPIFDEHGAVSVAVYLMGFRAPVHGSELERIGSGLAASATTVSRATGGRPPELAAIGS